MNERDIAFMDRFLREVAGSENGRRVLLSVRYNQINKINLILLRALMMKLGKRGLFVTVDRPHQYMTYLLDINKIPRDDLLFMDIISRFSGESTRNGAEVAGKDATPFKIGEL
jgi:hypothetical protein